MLITGESFAGLQQQARVDLHGLLCLCKTLLFALKHTLYTDFGCACHTCNPFARKSHATMIQLC